MTRIWSLLNNGVEFATGIGFIMFITHTFSLEASGLWFIFIAFFALVSSLRDALIQSALIKSTAGNSENSKFSSLITILIIIILFETVIGAIIVIVGFAWRGDFGHLLVLYPLYSFPNAMCRWAIFYLRGQLKIKEIVFINLILFVGLITGSLVIYFTKPKLSYLLLSLCFANSVAMIFSIWSLPVRSMLKASVCRDTIKLVWSYGKYAMMREAISALSSRISLFFSGSFLSLQQTAILGVSQRFSQIALLPNNAFQSVLFPTLVQAVRADDMKLVKDHVEKSLAQLLAITLPLAIIGITISPLLLHFVGGASYKSGWGLLSVYLILSTLITPFGTAFGSLVTAIGRPSLAFKVVTVNSILNTALGYILMRTLGLWGAPMSLAFTEIIGLLWINKLSWATASIDFQAVVKSIPQVYKEYYSKVKNIKSTFSSFYAIIKN